MDVLIKKSVRNGLYATIGLFLFSFFYGGVYNGFVLEGIGWSGLILSFFGAILVALLFGFTSVFGLSLIIYYLKDKT